MRATRDFGASPKCRRLCAWDIPESQDKNERPCSKAPTNKPVLTDKKLHAQLRYSGLAPKCRGALATITLRKINNRRVFIALRTLGLGGWIAVGICGVPVKRRMWPSGDEA